MFKVKTEPKTCVVCGKVFDRGKTEGLEKWAKRKSCSPTCGNIIGATSRKGHTFYHGRWKNHKLKRKNCLVCGKEYEQPKGIRGKTWERRKACSKECRAEWNRRQGHGFKKGHEINVGRDYSNRKYKKRLQVPPKICVICGSQYEKAPDRGLKNWQKSTTCSRKCGLEIGIKNLKTPPKGKEHWCWKGGVTPLRNKIHETSEYRNWRTAVFKRDDFTCQKCGKKGGYLNADHIKRFSVIISENQIKTVEQAKACRELWDVSNGRTLCVDCHRKTHTYGRRIDKSK
jgi:5-methylcytosine-specific restriction endonuclease McrA